MTSYPNPALRSVAIRTIGPFVPVWLFGIVFGLLLARADTSGTLDPVQLLTFLSFYTLLVGASVAALFLRQYQSTPDSVDIDVEGVVAPVHRRPADRPDGRHSLALPYERISTLAGGGLTGWRIEERPAESSRLDWINLTEENAGRIADAMEAWRRREAPPEEAVPLAAIAV